MLHYWWREATILLDANQSLMDERRAWFLILMLTEEIDRRKERKQWDCVCEICVEPFPA